MEFSDTKRFLALDLGDKRTGVAVSDALQLTAQGLVSIKGTVRVNWLDELDLLFKQYDVGAIVLGFPRNMNGSVGEKGEKAKRVAQMLQTRYQIPVHLWDERLSTSAVERTLLEADMSRNKRKKVIDKMAASWILQGFLDAQRR